MKTERRILSPGTMVGEYRIESILGEGGMGAIYAAVHPLIGKQAAVKVLHPFAASDAYLVQRFIQEAQAVSLVRHPGIIDIFSIGELADHSPYLIMERLHGMNLEQYLGANGRFGLELTLNVLDAVLEPLEVAHQAGIIHRDIKPENLFLLNERRPPWLLKILDFGIAKLLGGGEFGLRVRLTRPGELFGSPFYMAPEQI